jgi:23S rRNA (adenine2503-C2)-methyltransferase
VNMPAQHQVLFSKEDASVNFVMPNGLEARFVYRPDSDYFIVYLSSHRGCNQACRFCHLTQTRQTDMTPATMEEYDQQTKLVMNHYMSLLGNEKIPFMKKVHFNWMARGEPLLNPTLLKDWSYLSFQCRRAAEQVGIYNTGLYVSTIMPGIEDPLINFYKSEHAPKIYYSLYSVNPEFRKRWLPKAMDPTTALANLKKFQLAREDHTGQEAEIVLHWAFIEGQNDSIEDLDRLIDTVNESGLKTRFNLVRYNPYSDVQGREPSEDVVQLLFSKLSSAMKFSGSRIVPRVGKDVYASCGMFINQIGN